MFAYQSKELIGSYETEVLNITFDEGTFKTKENPEVKVYKKDATTVVVSIGGTEYTGTIS